MELAMRPHRCSLRERSGRQGRGRQGGAVGRLSWPETRWIGRESSPRRWRSEMGGSGGVDVASEARGGSVAA